MPCSCPGERRRIPRGRWPERSRGCRGVPSGSGAVPGQAQQGRAWSGAQPRWRGEDGALLELPALPGGQHAAEPTAPGGPRGRQRRCLASTGVGTAAPQRGVKELPAGPLPDGIGGLKGRGRPRGFRFFGGAGSVRVAVGVGCPVPQPARWPPCPCRSRPVGSVQSLAALRRAGWGRGGRACPGWGGEPAFPSGIGDMETIEQSVTTVYRKNCQGFIYWK